MLTILKNARVDRAGAYDDARCGGLSEARFLRARDFIRGVPGYAATPLLSLDDVAAHAGVSAVGYKAEALRFGLGSFKALGGVYGVAIALGRQDAPGSPGAEGSGLPEGAASMVCCATDGNHGRAVAWAARRAGCRAVVFVGDPCSAGAEARIRGEGAAIVRISGSYEDAHDAVVRSASENGWLLVSDTAVPGNERIPGAIMDAYQVVVDEALGDAAEPPTHVIVQAGTGGLAAAVCAYFWRRDGARRPVLVVVESDQAASLMRSAARGESVRIEGPHRTRMAGLACGEASLLAWSVLSTGADCFAALSDAALPAAREVIARGESGARLSAAGDSGLAGLAALCALAGDPDAWRTVGLGPRSRILLIGTE
ncbi:MAG: diaminopropionate ammonia-lyase [Longimicrobiaceae bacterium]